LSLKTIFCKILQKNPAAPTLIKADKPAIPFGSESAPREVYRPDSGYFRKDGKLQTSVTTFHIKIANAILM